MPKKIKSNYCETRQQYALHVKETYIYIMRKENI